MNSLAENRVFTPPVAARLFKRLVATAVAACVMTGIADRSAAQSGKLTDSQRKALILYNFAKFTEWPKSAFTDDTASFVLGVLGKDPFGKDMDILRGKAIKGRKVEVRYFRTVDALTNCHLLYISKSEIDNLPQIRKRLEKCSILTAAEAQGFIDQDGIINLVPERQPNGTETVGFEINLPAAEKANLKLDTQLLKLAKKVKS